MAIAAQDFIKQIDEMSVLDLASVRYAGARLKPLPLEAVSRLGQELYAETGRLDPAYLGSLSDDARIALRIRRLSSSTRKPVRSPRAIIAWGRLAKVWAVLVRHRDEVFPEDIQDLAAYVLAHRVWLGPHAASHGLTPELVIKDVIERVAIP